MLYFWQKQLTYNKIQLTIWQRGTENNFSIPLFFTLKNCQIKNCLSNISYLSSPKMRTNCGHAAQNKNPKQLVCKCLGFFTGTRSRDRTGTAITGHRILSPACLPIPPSEQPPFVRKAGQKYELIFYSARKRTVLVRLDAGGSAPDSDDGRGNRKPYHSL